MHWDCLLLSVGDGLYFEKFNVLEPVFKAKPKMNHGLLFLEKIDLCLSPEFQGNILEKLRKKGFSIVLAWKQQKRRDSCFSCVTFWWRHRIKNVRSAWPADGFVPFSQLKNNMVNFLEEEFNLWRLSAVWCHGKRRRVRCAKWLSGNRNAWSILL